MWTFAILIHSEKAARADAEDAGIYATEAPLRKRSWGDEAVALHVARLPKGDYTLLKNSNLCSTDSRVQICWFRPNDLNTSRGFGLSRHNHVSSSAGSGTRMMNSCFIPHRLSRVDQDSAITSKHTKTTTVLTCVPTATVHSKGTLTLDTDR